ncbi:MAG TPA: DUF3306 domain-containing protein, partial [Xanthobacteraceae bacterium]|nr:DUF3306 domain-containing protein [Xanthobacteraceae bacterium]
ERVSSDSRLRENERVHSAEQAGEAEFDVSMLPPLESISAETDIRAFLARGVPAALRRAALSRAWAADPAIRDFIGPSENAWDFTAPGGVPGFGPLEAVEAGPSLDLLRAGQAAVQPSSPAESLVSPLEQAQADDIDMAATRQAPEEGAHEVVNAYPQQGSEQVMHTDQQSGREANKQNEDVAAQEARNAAETDTVLLRRRHGGALPG